MVKLDGELPEVDYVNGDNIPVTQLIEIADSIGTIEDFNDEIIQYEEQVDSWDFEDMREELMLAVDIEKTKESIPSVDYTQWLRYLQDHPSRVCYERIVDLYETYATPFRTGSNGNEMKLATDFFFYCREQKNSKGLRRYSPTSFQSWHSILWQYLRYSGKGDLKREAPLIQDSIKKWMKTHTILKASTFRQNDLGTYGYNTIYLFLVIIFSVDRFYRMINTETVTPELLSELVLASCAVPYAARNIESKQLQFEDLRRIEDKGCAIYILKYMRKKQKGSPCLNEAFITGSLQVSILDRYIHCFPEEDRKGTFYRKLIYKKQSADIIGTKSNIGKNVLATYGRRIATRLGMDEEFVKKATGFHTKYLLNCTNYLYPFCTNLFHFILGHLWRRTAVTLMAESGNTLVEIKSVTGHNSDTVVQGYIDNTETLRRKSSEALQFNDSTNPSSKQQRTDNNYSDSNSAINSIPNHIHISFEGATINAPLTIGYLPYLYNSSDQKQ